VLRLAFSIESIHKKHVEPWSISTGLHSQEFYLVVDSSLILKRLFATDITNTKEQNMLLLGQYYYKRKYIDR
jgi:hypothetical protein